MYGCYIKQPDSNTIMSGIDASPNFNIKIENQRARKSLELALKEVKRRLRRIFEIQNKYIIYQIFFLLFSTKMYLSTFFSEDELVLLNKKEFKYDRLYGVGFYTLSQKQGSQ